MKRKNTSSNPADAGASSDEAEMDVDEEKREVDEDNEDDEDIQPDEDDEEGDGAGFHAPPAERSEFLDAFYGLASTEPRERAVAGQVILHHTMLGSQANITDASYALKRLLNGLCSGRAAARQGNASCLASFLKISNGNGVLREIQLEQEDKEGDEEGQSLLAYVRKRLITATSQHDSSSSGRRKAAEIKDNNFGRLFGVLAIVRSGILTPERQAKKGDDDKIDDILAICKAFLADLKELYTFKAFMREPAAHAVCTLLNLFFRLARNKDDCAKTIVSRLVDNTVIPMFLETGDLADDEDKKQGSKSQSPSPFATYSAEQLAIALNLQTNSALLDFNPKQPALNEAFFTEDTLPSISTTLASTCGVNQPRTHLVWDTIWLFLTESVPSENNAVDERKLRSRVGGSNKEGTEGNVLDMLTTIINEVVVKKLLSPAADEEDGQGDAPSGRRSAHDRRALALTLVRTMAGIEFISSVSGRTVISLDADFLGSVVFQSSIVRSLLVNVIAAGASGRKGQGDHMLKPVALDTLKQITELSTDEDKGLAICKALVRCEPRFDGRTRTSTVHNLLGLNLVSGSSEEKENKVTEKHYAKWSNFVEFLQIRILQTAERSDSDDDMDVEDLSTRVSTHDAVALIDTMYNLAKQVARIKVKESSGEGSLQADHDSLVQEIVSFMLAVSFAEPSADGQPKKKKKKKQKGTGKAVKVADKVKGLSHPIPFDTRKVLSSRFFSLLADNMNAASHMSVSNRKEIEMLNVMLYAVNECRDLEHHGYTLFPSEIRDEDKEEPTCPEIVFGLLKNAQKAIDEMDETPSLKDRFEVSIALLVSFLRLCQLNCSDPSEDQDVAEMADHEDVEEIRDFVEEIKDCADEILGRGGEGDKDEVSNPLSSLVAMSINLLSTSMGESSDGARGASSRLSRELVKVVLSTGLMFSAKSSNGAKIDTDLAHMMMQSIGVTIEETDDMDDIDDSDDESDSPEQEGLFSKNADASLLDDEDEEMDADGSNDKENDVNGDDKTGDEEEVMIDSDRLNSMLEDSDIDVEESELEHHEGADKALAKLIKLKQEARKAGQAARERLELSQQLRCMLVLETFLSGKPEGWGPLLRADVLMLMIPQLLERWGELEKLNSKSTGKGSNPVAGERFALLARIASVVKSKLLKAKMGSMAWSESVNAEEHCQSVASRILEVAGRRTLSKELQACCFHSLPALFRSLPGGAQAASGLYSEAIAEWTSKKTPIDTRLLEELIKTNPVMAQSILVEPLVKSLPNAYSSFIKSECFRLLSMLYNPKLNSAGTEQEKAALKTLFSNRDTFVEVAVATLDDEEMQKAKRIKEVLRCVKEVVSFSSSDEALNSPISTKSTEALEAALKEAGAKTESDVTKNLCETLLSNLEQNQQQATKSNAKQNKKKKKKNKKKR